MTTALTKIPFVSVAAQQPFWLPDRHDRPIHGETYHRLTNDAATTANARCTWRDQEGAARATDVELAPTQLVFVAEDSAPPSDPRITELLATMRADGIARVDWTVYWYADQTELHATIFSAADGAERERFYEGELPPDWHDVLWTLSDLFGGDEPDGTFELDVAERIVRHTGDAWMAEPELETLPFARDKVVTRMI